MTYGGSYRIDGKDVIHQVIHALNLDLIGAEQLRHVHIGGDELVLTGEEAIGPVGVERFHKVLWRCG